VTRGQWFTSSANTSWFFDSGAVCLDFGYTGGFGGRPEWERLRSPEELGAWLAERFPLVDPASATDRDLRDALTLRQAVVAITNERAHAHFAPPREIDMLNLYAAVPDIPPQLAGGSRQAGAGSAKASQALGSIARDAVALFRDAGEGRIRTCAADDCDLVFYDESRSGSRRWCSMQRCGNRAKVRTHRAKVAAAAS
jgi:predicted RNA-binding Zn ribbon-like protein